MSKQQLTKNLWRHEFFCECGNCEYEAADFTLVTELQSLIDYVTRSTGLNVKISITSGNRCPDHNANISGAASRSKHLYSLAVDFHLYYMKNGKKVRLNMRPIYDYMFEKFAGQYGIAYYHNGGRNRIHFDVAQSRRPWRKIYG